MPKRILQGVVVCDKQDKTLVVKVERRFTHPLLKKTVRRSKNYHAHDENKTHKVGDGLDRGDPADLEAEALDRDRRDGGEGLSGELRSARTFIPGARASFRRSPAAEAPETDLSRKAIRP